MEATAAATSTDLRTAAQALLQSATHEVKFESTGHKFTFVSPCSGLSASDENILESASVLAAARTLSKLGRADIAWSFLRSLFESQGTNGFMPKYMYLNEAYDDSNNMPEFIGPFPGPKHFRSRKKYTPNNINVWSSNTLMASPYHATTILEVFYLSNQTAVDVENLHFFYNKLKAWQGYLHDRLIMKCIASTDISVTVTVTEKRPTFHPCLVVHHPWETEVDMQSPIWTQSFNILKDEVANTDWVATFEATEAVKESFDYPGDEDYNSLMYLLECISNNSSGEDNKPQQSYGHIQTVCPFAIIDVGLTSSLAKSDQDMLQIQQILTNKNRLSNSQREMDAAESRIHISRKMLHALWDNKSGNFFNRAVELELNSNGTYTTNKTTVLDVAVAYNFNALWAPLSNATMVEYATTHMIQPSGKFSFGCGDYPIRSTGGCKQGYDASPAVFPLLNYRVATGLKRNDAELERFIQISTLNLICGTSNSDESDLTNCSDNLLFASAFNATAHRPLGKGACGLTSTLTASIVLDLLSDDKPFRYDSEPPISSSSVIVLIAIEMVIAMAIGLNCLILSLNLVRRANVDEEDAFFQIDIDLQTASEQELLVQSPGLSEGFGTPMGSFDETYNPQGFLAWSHDILSRLNPMNVRSVAPAPSASGLQTSKNV